MASKNPTQANGREPIRDPMWWQAEIARGSLHAAVAAQKALSKTRERFNLPTRHDLVRGGIDLVQRAASHRPAVAPRTSSLRTSAPPVPAPTRQPNRGVNPRRNLLDLDSLAKSAAGAVALHAGQGPGVARGAWHTATELFPLAERLTNPVGSLIEDLASVKETYQNAKNLAGRAAEIIHDPRGAVADVREAIDQQIFRLDPHASSPAPTFAEEVRRNFQIGLNKGELAFDVGSLAYGAGEARALAKLATFAKPVAPAATLRPGLADYFATPYTGVGHHYLPRRTKLPGWMGGGPVPKVIGDSPFFLLKPWGISTGDMYKMHFEVDPKYFGGNVPAEFGGGGWSGRRIGWDKHGTAGTLWFGAPAPLKFAVGGGVLGVGALVDQIDQGEEKR